MSASNYEDRLQQLLQLEFFGMKLGLENIRALLADLDDPQETYPTIHIAGTNGKGSVAATFAAIYQASGKRVGLYMSPHLVDFRERIRVNGAMIDREYMIRFIERVWPFVEERNMTFFEVTTAMAFRYFADEAVDIAVIETGLGGRLDATNVLKRPVATVITSIAMDHMAQLGGTLEAIANEKAGIFKADVPAIVNCRSELRGVFESRAKEVRAPLTFVGDVGIDRRYSDIAPSLAGEHQHENLRTVLTALTTMHSALPAEDVREGVAGTTELTGLQARLQRFESAEFRERGVELVLDAGHNPAALARVADHFESIGVRPIVVLGLMKDKDVAGVLVELKRVAQRIVAVSVASQRALASVELAAAVEAAGIQCDLAADPSSGVSFAVSTARQGDVVLLTGSHYIIGEFLQNFQKTSRVRDRAS